MKAFLLALTVIFAIHLVIAASVPAAAALEEGADEQVIADDDPSTDVAHGLVRVNVIEWKPDLSGVGAGLFTQSEFDFSEFLGKLALAVSALLGI
jgi:hypothetical protein